MLLKLTNVLDAPALNRIAEQLAAAQFSDGKLTAGAIARQVKRNLQLEPGAEPAKSIGATVVEALRRHSAFVAAALPHKISSPLVNRYESGMEYGAHVDNAIMWQPTPLRADIAITLFLSDASSYDGGELIIEDSTFAVHRVKLAPGEAVLYPANTVHRVAPVTRGHRDAAVTWVQSLVRDAEQRRILFDLERVAAGLHARTPEAPELSTLNTVYHGLLRLWAEA